MLTASMRSTLRRRPAQKAQDSLLEATGAVAVAFWGRYGTKRMGAPEVVTSGSVHHSRWTQLLAARFSAAASR